MQLRRKKERAVPLWLELDKSLLVVKQSSSHGVQENLGMQPRI